MLKRVLGVPKIKQTCDILCYVFDEVVGQTKEMLLISLSAIIQAKINILYHMRESNRNICKELQFWSNNKTFEEVCDDIGTKEEIHKLTRHHEKYHSRDIYLSSEELQEVEEAWLCDVTQEVYMTEIQLRRIVERNAMEGSEQQSDGDERMMKDGENIASSLRRL
jgi:hypothetical protein